MHVRPCWLVQAAPFLVLLAPVPLWWTWERGYWGLVGEDRLAEWVTFAAYVAIAFGAVAIARRLLGQRQYSDFGVYALFVVGAVFVAGEEVNWFQRLLGYEGPREIVSRNRQDVANLHNLLSPSVLHALFVAAGLYGALFGRLLAPRLPLLRRSPSLYAPPRSLATWFLCAAGYYAWTFLNSSVTQAFGPTAHIEYLTGPSLQEVAELCLAVGAALFILRILRARAGSRSR